MSLDPARPPFIVGVDTGGTFTDCVVIDAQGRVHGGKAPSTPPQFSEGILQSLRVVAESLGLSSSRLLSETAVFAHGSTVATNAMLTRSGSRAGLLATLGFEDTLLIMRGGLGRFAGLDHAEAVHMARTAKPDPIIPRPLIKGIHERVDRTGQVLVPLDREQATRAIDELVEAGVESIGISLLWSFRNDAHERLLRELIQQRYPHIFVSVSSDLAPFLGEYERTSTVALNAYLGPAVARYLHRLDEQLAAEGLPRSPLIMQAYGGSLPLERAAQQPITTIHSGPVGGLVASQLLARALSYENAITTDVGGTSFDVGLIYNGKIERAREAVVAQYSLLTPMLEIASVGAGGGSIAWVEPETGILHVGPQSAGARPGPVCYDAGGTEPTVTDADLILGYLNPDNFLGGRMRLNLARAQEAVQRRVGDALGLSTAAAAAAIYDIVNAHMSDLVRKVTIQRGYDPRTCVMFVYGGAGAVHAGAYGADLGVKSTIVPPSAAVHSALGIASSDIVHTYGLSDHLVAPFDAPRLNERFQRLEDRARADLAADGFSADAIALDRQVAMRYRRQIHEMLVPVPLGELAQAEAEALLDVFDRVYEQAYGAGSAYREAGVELMRFEVRASGATLKPALPRSPLGSSDPSAALRQRRPVYFRSLGGFTECPVFAFDGLRPGNEIAGPALVETPVTTVVVHPGQVAHLDELGNVVVNFTSS
ncbi:MAG: hydantoinase/oxoprolinase family protein [Chloroflexi bacterium]|nr:hydantoinase/oxoprolinase family protein [Chloroflexota bacterium]